MKRFDYISSKINLNKLKQCDIEKYQKELDRLFISPPSKEWYGKLLAKKIEELRRLEIANQDKATTYGFWGKISRNFKSFLAELQQAIDSYKVQEESNDRFDFSAHIYLSMDDSGAELSFVSEATILYEAIRSSAVSLSVYLDYEYKMLALQNCVLLRLKCLISAAFDKREQFRSIIMLLFKNLDDEHAALNNTLRISLKELFKVTTNEKARNRYSYQ